MNVETVPTGPTTLLEWSNGDWGFHDDAEDCKIKLTLSPWFCDFEICGWN